MNIGKLRAGETSEQSIAIVVMIVAVLTNESGTAAAVVTFSKSSVKNGKKLLLVMPQCN